MGTVLAGCIPAEVGRGVGGGELRGYYLFCLRGTKMGG